MPLADIEELKTAILSLPETDYAHLRQWFLGDIDWQTWDAQIMTDSDAGKLDFLVDEALENKRDGSLTDL